MQHAVYLFDRFRLDVTRRKLLSASGLVLPLNSRAMEALLLLVAHAGEVIDRRRLMQTIWPHTIVEDNNLNQCILAIRKALGEVAGSNQFVMTVPGRGFCFVCPVHVRHQESEDEVQQPAAAPSPADGNTHQHATAPMRIGSLHWRAMAARHPFLLGAISGGGIVAMALLPFALH
ncbi:MAG: transcriptional regulator [Pseudomonadota bacterium]|nr:transcriptional regulator [Pseudomonadota bacterium]